MHLLPAQRRPKLRIAPFTLVNALERGKAGSSPTISSSPLLSSQVLYSLFHSSSLYPSSLLFGEVLYSLVISVFLGQVFYALPDKVNCAESRPFTFFNFFKISKYIPLLSKIVFLHIKLLYIRYIRWKSCLNVESYLGEDLVALVDDKTSYFDDSTW